MKAYPDNIKEISFLATLDRTAPYRPWFAALGATAYWGIGLFGTRRPRVFDAEQLEEVEPVIDTSTARGAVQYQDAYLVDNDSRFVFSFVRSAVEAGAAVANYVELVSAERVGDRWVVPAARHRLRRRGHDVGPRRGQRRRPVRRRAQRAPGVCTTQAPHRLLQGHPPRRPPAHHDPPRPGARLLRRHRAAVLRHPDGPPLGHRHHRHPHRHPLHARHRRGPRLPARPDQRPPRPAAAAHRRRRHRRALRRPPARRPERGRRPPGRRLDLPEPQARDRARHRPRRRHRLRRQAHRLPQRRRGGRRPRARRSASRSRRTCATGTASRPGRPARSSTARPA